MSKSTFLFPALTCGLFLSFFVVVSVVSFFGSALVFSVIAG